MLSLFFCQSWESMAGETTGFTKTNISASFRATMEVWSLSGCKWAGSGFLISPDRGWDFLAQFALLQPLFKKPISIYILSSSVDYKEKARALEYSFVGDFYSKPIKRAQLEDLYCVYQNTHRQAG